MKKYMLLMLSLLTFIFVACDDEGTDNISKEYSLTLQGGQSMIFQLGDTFVEPGFVATYGGTDVSKQIVVEGEVNGSTVGLYSVDYTYTPENGVPITHTRSVIVADKSVTLDISGNYVTSGETHRAIGSNVTPFTGQDIKITKVAPGFFEVSDFIGGYYSIRAGYGSAYASGGYIQVENDGTMTLLSANAAAFGSGIATTELQNTTYDAATSAMSWDAIWNGWTFHIELTKKEE